MLVWGGKLVFKDAVLPAATPADAPLPPRGPSPGAGVGTDAAAVGGVSALGARAGGAPAEPPGSGGGAAAADAKAAPTSPAKPASVTRPAPPIWKRPTNAKELSAEQLQYMEKTIQPLLQDMVDEALCLMPAKLGHFFCSWLLGHLAVPHSIGEPVLSWLRVPSTDGRRRSSTPKSADPVPEEAPQAAAPAPAAPAEEEEAAEAAGDEGDAAREAAAADSEEEEEDTFSPNMAVDDAPKPAFSVASGLEGQTKRERAMSILKRPKDDSDKDKVAKDRVADLQKRKVSISVLKMTETVEVHADERRDSFGICKQRMRRGRAVSIFRPPPVIPHEEAVAMIKKVPLFKRLTDEDASAVAHAAQVRTFDTDEEVVRCGDLNKELHIIWSGSANVSVPTMTGTLKSGDFFGEHALTKTHVASSNSITAAGGENSTTVTLALTRHDFEQLDLLDKLRAQKNPVQNFVARTGTSMGKRRGTPVGMKCVKDTIQKDVHEKSQQDRQLILQALRANAHFTTWLSLSERQMETMADMMRMSVVESGHHVITAGEQGHNFYIVNDGILDVLMDEDTAPRETMAGSLRIGDSFGELALLYNCPRKATIRASRRCELWVLSRDKFRAVMRLKSESRVAEYQELISTVPMLKEKLTAEEKSTLAGAMEEAFFVKDEQIVVQGEEGSTFYIVFEGSCEVRVNGASKGLLQKGQYFGERALLTSEPRAATVVCASGTATLLALDSGSFSFLLGDHFQEIQDQLEMAKDSVPQPSDKANARSLDRLLKGDIGKMALVPLDRLECMGALGFGAFGHVTLQRDRESQKMYALKALSKGYIKREQLQDHVLSERKTLAMLDSEFCTILHCTYRDDQYVYFLLEAALGGELYDVYDANPKFFGSERHARFYSVCATLGLEHLHSRKIVYRDLKMENVLLAEDGYAMLTDMGLAKVVIGKTFTVCGTADYFAPETLRQAGHNRAVDWWAFGIMLFIMMAGRSPFDAGNVMQIYKNIVKGFKKDHFPDSFSPDLCNLIKSICRKKPEERLPMGPGGAKNLEAHNWFRELPFEKVERQLVKAPYEPPPPDFEKFVEKQKMGPPPEVEFVENDPSTDNGWDDEFV